MRQPADLCSLCFSYAMDELTLFEQRRYAKHLRACAPCQREYMELMQLRRQAEVAFSTRPKDTVALYLHPFGRQFYWLAASAMALFIGLSVSLPHHAHLIGRFAETASDVHHGITDHLEDFSLFARHLLQEHAVHENPHSFEI